MTSTGVNTSTMLLVKQLKHAETKVATHKDLVRPHLEDAAPPSPSIKE